MEIKKIGSNISLKGIVIHQVVKYAGNRNTNLKKAHAPIDIKEKEQSFIGKLNRAYFKKSSPIYGIFGNQDTKFREQLKSYLEHGDFYNFTVEAATHYKKKLEETVPATGGFMIFAHFSNTETYNDYMLVLTINNKDGFVVSESDLTIKDIKNLDLNNVDVACMINLTKWENISNGIDKEGKTYLSFVKGNKNVSYYFMSFIDCNNKTTSSESTQKLIHALEAYSKAQNFDRDTKIRKRNEVFIYCEECMNNKKEIQLSAISALLDPENTAYFQEFAADEKYGVSSTISGDRSKLKLMKFVTYKDKKMTIEFDCNLLGKDVFYNAELNKLTIKNLPQGLINQIPK